MYVTSINEYKTENIRGIIWIFPLLSVQWQHYWMFDRTGIKYQ